MLSGCISAVSEIQEELGRVGAVGPRIQACIGADAKPLPFPARPAGNVQSSPEYNPRSPPRPHNKGISSSLDIARPRPTVALRFHARIPCKRD